MISGLKINHKINHKINNKSNIAAAGFTLIEVVIAITLFAIFIIAFISTEGSNVRDSVNMKEELLLQKLCENKLNQIILDPPELTESLTLIPKSGSLDEEGYADYEYTVEYKRLKIPNLSAITGEGEEDGASSGGGSGSGEGAAASGESASSASSGDPQADKESKDKQAKMFQNKVFEMMKKNIEEMIWQVKVTVQNKSSKFPFSLVSFIDNKKAKVKLDL
ncbi:MAG: prepilin-type N-terminal cleavage/methylation domain-containing protein [Oligoflexia bacterium]|nr:prepilin-type N-terminal cleavage/methylation domain-containing protein [Oligoflexia bacterium]